VGDCDLANVPMWLRPHHGTEGWTAQQQGRGRRVKRR